MAMAQAGEWLKALLVINKLNYNGHVRTGIAPKTRVEQKVEAVMKKQGMWLGPQRNSES